ncbi:MULTISPECIES: hypothetical protein [Rhodococcus]|uniref:hypothetical protein n=1 Tax=Rhodococcus TaxID=1827 RepID=UPI0029536240|nr:MULTISPECIES: hypothetical protein [Rhodococcus]MDV7246727.1 hypothetical protein [Rhodococcus oxybenzonivorans]MDV7337740.1 hypothetical protein [Rhodococcus oxybenzonivorans]MDV7347796.1 hypothetical protein [Rhodococcus oxybenzonivorans]MDV8031504.1 hypothetical protein [Rhodococcus sp. IEGM 27]
MALAGWATLSLQQAVWSRIPVRRAKALTRPHRMVYPTTRSARPRLLVPTPRRHTAAVRTTIARHQRRIPHEGVILLDQ